MFRGSFQGEGVECFWDKLRVIESQDGHYYVENPDAKLNSVTNSGQGCFGEAASVLTVRGHFYGNTLN
jgi:hypothetical protein